MLPSVCIRQDAASAKAVAFHRDVMTKCVTHDGDLFDPSGTLTGGSRSSGASVLAKLHALSEAEAHLQTCTSQRNGAH
jgi:structural maintenance of chromosome 2